MEDGAYSKAGRFGWSVECMVEMEGCSRGGDAESVLKVGWKQRKDKQRNSRNER